MKLAIINFAFCTDDMYNYYVIIGPYNKVNSEIASLLQMSVQDPGGSTGGSCQKAAKFNFYFNIATKSMLVLCKDSIVPSLSVLKIQDLSQASPLNSNCGSLPGFRGPIDGLHIGDLLPGVTTKNMTNK